MKYLLDANVFIEAKNRYYGLEFCPAFWDWLIENKSTLCSIDKVKEELLNQKDELTEWIRESIDPVHFEPSHEELTPYLTTISKWIDTRQNYIQAAKDKFKRSADYYVIAYAKAHGLVLVTHEESAPQSKRIIKIPDVCNALGIAYVNTFDMLREEKALFVLK